MTKNAFILNILQISEVPHYELNPDLAKNDPNYTVPTRVFEFINRMFQHIDIEGLFRDTRITYIEYEMGFCSMLVPGDDMLFIIGPYIQNRLTTEEYFARLIDNGFPVTPEMNAFYQSLYLMTSEKMSSLLDLFSEYIGISGTRTLFQRDILPTSRSQVFTLMNDTYTEHSAGRLIEAEDRLMKALLAGNRALADEALAAYRQVLSDTFDDLDLGYLRQQLHNSNGIYHRICFIRLWLPYLCDSFFYRFRDRIDRCRNQDQIFQLRKEMNDTYFDLLDRAPKEKYSGLISSAVAYLQKNSTQEFNLPDMASSLSVNKTYLCERFRRETGKCITDYLNEIRVGEAVTLLHTTNLNISAIAATCGFHDANYFSRVFRKIRGISPREERNSGRILTAD